MVVAVVVAVVVTVVVTTVVVTSVVVVLVAVVIFTVTIVICLNHSSNNHPSAIETLIVNRLLTLSSLMSASSI